MQIHITARHVNLTPAISNYLTKKVNRLERYFDHLVWANAILTVEKYRQMAEIIIHSPLHTMRAKAESTDLYSAIDLVGDKMEKQLKRLKERWKNQKHVGLQKSLRSSVAFYPEATDLAPDGPSPWPASISVVKQVPVEPTAVERAIQTMESAGYNFWLFLNKRTKKLNVIFKRADETYGILEPVKK